MAHMFLVEYVTNHVNGMVESGKVIVIADSHEQTHDVVCQHMQLPTSRTQCKAGKIKPPCYVVKSRESYPDKQPSAAARPDREREPRVRYNATIAASNVAGRSEREVLRKIGEELVARGMLTQLRHHLQMTVDCSPAGNSKSPLSAMQKIEMYRPTGWGMQGGPVRGR
jgi:hypothetical protein